MFTNVKTHIDFQLKTQTREEVSCLLNETETGNSNFTRVTCEI